MQSKICQGGDKGLMSNPNKDLGKWILRDILKMPEQEILTYSKLEDIGIDSVRIDKISPSEFEMNFAKTGSYEEFIKNFTVE
jgi:hypothetical protein